MEFIVQPNVFSSANVSITAPKIKKTPNGNRVKAYFNYNNNPVYIATPQLKAPFGASDFNGDGKFSVQVNASAVRDDDEKMVSEWIEQMRNIDTSMINWAIENWEVLPCFKKKPSYDAAEGKFTGLIKESDNPKYPPKMKFSFSMTRFYEGMKDADGNDVTEDTFVPEANFEIYSDSNEAIEVSSLEDLRTIIPRGSLIRMCFQPTFWVSPNGFGITCPAMSLQVSSRSFSKPSGNIWGAAPSFAESAPAASSATDSSPAASVPVPDSDDEGQDDGPEDESPDDEGSDATDDDEDEDSDAESE